MQREEASRIVILAFSTVGMAEGLAVHAGEIEAALETWNPVSNMLPQLVDSGGTSV